jgi:hypothetical protein
MKTELRKARGDYFFSNDHKVVISYHKVNWNILGSWCKDHLQGEVISSCDFTKTRTDMIWYFEYASDATLFALRWS